MPTQDKDIIAKVIAECTPLDKYTSVIDWYDDFKKRIRAEIRSKGNRGHKADPSRKKISKGPKRQLSSRINNGATNFTDESRGTDKGVTNKNSKSK